MKRLLLFVGLFMFIGGASFAQTYKYVGSKKCGMCHKKDAKGNQLKKWSTAKHSKAFETLSSDKAKEYANSAGIADATTAKVCLNCHSTAGSVDATLLTKSITIEEGVSCEACHGAGSEYKSMFVMKKQEVALTKGLILPSANICKKCHEGENKYHELKAFVYETEVVKVAHPNPKKQK